MFSTVGLVCCLRADFTACAQFYLFSKLAERGHDLLITDLEVLPLSESGIVVEDKDYTDTWTFTYAIEGGKFDKIVEGALAHLVNIGVVYSYVIDHHLSEEVISQN
jgi:hypothetical protein